MLQVSLSAGLFAASHLAADGFVQLFFLGTMLGVGHLYSRNNLFVPTLAHAVFNCVLFFNILFK